MSATLQSSIYLSKSLYLTGLQCHKALWLQKYQPELKDEVPPEMEPALDFGSMVGRLAQGLFPGGIPIPYSDESHSEQMSMTREAMAKGASTIYEGSFGYDAVFVKADILHLRPNGWELFEVKSSASLKEHYLDDIAIQYHVICGAGLPLAKASLVHLNTQYVRQGPVDVRELFTVVDVSETIQSMQPGVEANLIAMRATLNGHLPVLDIGTQCENSSGCLFHGHCWAHVPKNSVFDFRGPGRPNAFELYRQGIVRMEDVPAHTLKWRHRLQFEGVLYRKSHIDRNAIKDFLNSLWFPLCFMDFETTYMVPIPMFDGMRPYEQLPFQFSMHVIEKEGEEPVHCAYLAKDLKDPSWDFLTNLLAAIPPGACVLTWNKVFELKRLDELALKFPSKAARIKDIESNVRDLMVPFRDKSIYHWKLNGSYSIKDVLPALVEGYSYDDLPIKSGDVASSTWVQMIQEPDLNEKRRLYSELLDYCHLDTWAMVLILAEMRKLST